MLGHGRVGSIQRPVWLVAEMAVDHSTGCSHAVSCNFHFASCEPVVDDDDDDDDAQICKARPK